MTIEDQIKDEKLQYDINREAAKISALSSGKIDRYEYLTGEEILPSNQRQIIEQDKFTYSPLGKAFEKKVKTIKKQREKQVDALESLKPFDKELPSIKDFIPIENLNPEIINEIKRIEEEEKRVNRNKMVYKATNKTYDFRKIKTIRAFGNEIKNNVVNDDMANNEQNKLLKHIEEINGRIRPRNLKLKELKKEVLDSVPALLQGREMILKAFQSGIFPWSKESQQEGEGLKMLAPNQMLKRLPIALAQIKAGNNSESLLNEIRQILYSFYRSKEITKKLYNNIINSIKV